MAERSWRPSDAILRRIKGFVRCVVEDVASNRSLSIPLDRYRNYCSDPSGSCICSSGLPCDVLLNVLLIVQRLLQENKHGSKRDIYYMKPSFFREQAVVDRAINDICILLKCSRHNLNVVPVGKGLVMGWLKFIEGGREIYCIRNPNTAYPIPVSVEDVEGIVSVARYILVVEKETVLQRLANDKFCDKNHCIVITGRGYPDVPTRRFLRHLVDQLQLPVFCLVDSDPYGFDILTIYRFGSLQMAYDAKLMCVPDIRWLGVFPSEFEKYQVPDRCLLQLTPEDKKKAQAMMLRCYLRQEAPQWRFELEIMLQKGVKFEIEALSVSSLSFLSEEYIPAKIQHGEHV
ncbi:meiotic recombination protein SPO11-1 isoform X2 [Asparagus officinalis]|uniref:meiotic recombination protein SPO11-1 isoform X2 n=1 Tax=Asparagus officinalis TaxID=4686 RepID=UPI00098E508C|nr:meiotic recombination protein SPO11-1 isoform X2 [Asparagus officinalis]